MAKLMIITDNARGELTICAFRCGSKSSGVERGQEIYSAHFEDSSDPPVGFELRSTSELPIRHILPGEVYEIVFRKAGASAAPHTASAIMDNAHRLLNGVEAARTTELTPLEADCRKAYGFLQELEQQVFEKTRRIAELEQALERHIHGDPWTFSSLLRPRSGELVLVRNRETHEEHRVRYEDGVWHFMNGLETRVPYEWRPLTDEARKSAAPSAERPFVRLRCCRVETLEGCETIDFLPVPIEPEDRAPARTRGLSDFGIIVPRAQAGQFSPGKLYRMRFESEQAL